jgi:hypothetical protein
MNRNVNTNSNLQGKGMFPFGNFCSTERLTLGKSGFCTERSTVDYREPIAEAGAIAEELRNAVLQSNNDHEVTSKAIHVAQEAFSKLTLSIEKKVSQAMIAASHADIVSLAVDKSNHPKLDAVDKFIYAQQIVLLCRKEKELSSQNLEFGNIIYRATEILKESERRISEIEDIYTLEVFARYVFKRFTDCKSQILKASCVREMEDFIDNTLEKNPPTNRKEMRLRLRNLLESAKKALSLEDHSKILTPATKGQILLWFSKERDNIYIGMHDGRPVSHEKPPTLENLSL